MNKSSITDEEFIKITESCQTVAQASKLCGMSYKTYIRKAKALGIFHKIKKELIIIFIVYTYIIIIHLFYY